MSTVSCISENCSFKTNIHGTFASHWSQTHTPHSLDDFKPELLQRYVNPLMAGGDRQRAASEDPEDEEIRELPILIEKNISHLLLKLQSTFNEPQMCMNELVEDLF